jgi:long-chain fatty acid transport protein
MSAGKIILIGLFSLSTTAFAAGYERSIMFGGKAGGLAGVTTTTTQGARSIYFNPSELAGRAGHSLTLDISPTAGKIQTPISDENTLETDNSFTSPGGIFYSYAPNEKWGFGVGIFPSGGSGFEFEDVTVSNTIDYRGTASVRSKIQLVEASIGAAYKISDTFKLGLAWRVLRADADFAFIQRGATGPVNTLANIELNNMTDTVYSGIRLGAAWDVTPTTHLGLTYRSEMEVKAEGTYGGKVLASAVLPPATPIDNSKAVAQTVFPQQLALGLKQNLSDTWNLYSEINWVNYSRVGNVSLREPITYGGGTSLTTDPPDLQQDWKDQYNVRIAGEYMGWSWPLRFGYMWTSIVTSKDFARSTSSAPGPGHTFTVGTGYSASENWTLDGAFEYGVQNGEGNGALAGQTGPGTDIRAGDHKATVYALHFGVEYSF